MAKKRAATASKTVSKATKKKAVKKKVVKKKKVKRKKPVVEDVYDDAIDSDTVINNESDIDFVDDYSDAKSNSDRDYDTEKESSDSDDREKKQSGGDSERRPRTRSRGRNNNRNNRGGGGGRNNNRRGGGGRNNRNNNNRNNKSRGRRGREPVEFDDAELTEGTGLLELHPNGYGFLRSAKNNYSRERSDPFVPGTMIEKFGLRPGVMIKGMVQPARRQQGPRLRELKEVDGMDPENYVDVKSFDDLTPINPENWYQMETAAVPLTTRVMDLLTPLGKGQRALIVAPPRSGKTVMLQHIAHGISNNYPDTKLIVLLIDERPEEVTDMKRNVDGEVIASSLDEDIESHVRLSQLVIQRCKRLAEMGQDVFLLMDSITRLARAFNKWVGNTGRTMSGGVDIKAMDIPKKLFSSARAFEEGGSLTICGTALIDTGSRMDELIFQEFKGTGNMELVLDRKLADRRVWPAIDISQSGTRREELLLSPDTLHAVTMLRRTLTSMHHVEAMEQLTKQLGRFKTNAEFITLISGKMADM
ncbi:MAG: transcription termination factor Rho [Planctomycetota bacterium]